MLRTFVLLAILAFWHPAVSTAQTMTPAQIQNLWAAQGNLSGSFTTTFADGSVAKGTFKFTGPVKLVMEYPSTNGRLVFDSRGMQEFDLATGTQIKNNPDSRFGAIFSRNPSFAAYVSRTGSDAKKKHTTLRFTDDNGSLLLYFANKNVRLTYIVIESNEGKSTTYFSY